MSDSKGQKVKKPLPKWGEMGLWDWVLVPARTAVFFWLNGWLMVLLVAGTVVQGQIGLFAAQEQYFNSWIWWIGGLIPAPGGQLTLLLVAWGLLIKVVRMQWRVGKIPSLLAHGGVLLLLLAGWATFQFSAAGTVILREGERTAEMVVTEAETPYPLPLPFEIQLVGFVHELHPGTDVAKSYKSEVVVREGPNSWPVTIEMNAPLRLKGYTVYQSSYVEGADGTASVLAVVKNAGRLWPYICSTIVGIGLLLYLLKRMGVSALAAIALMVLPMVGHAAVEEVRDWSKLPVMHEGRVKPLDTLARLTLRKLNGGEQLDGQSASRWLAGVVFEPAKAYGQRVFAVSDAGLRARLGLEVIEGGRYSFRDLLPGMQRVAAEVETLRAMEVKERGLDGEKLLALADDMAGFYALSRSLSLVLPLVPMDGGAVDYISYKDGKPSKDAEMVAAQLTRDRGPSALKVLPAPMGTAWMSPWQAVVDGRVLVGGEYLSVWRAMAVGWYAGDTSVWNSAVATAGRVSRGWDGVDARLLKLEVWVNWFKPLRASMGLYALAAVAVGMFMWKKLKIWRVAGVSLAAVALAIHASALVVRVMLLGRAPVGTLYESMVFVAAVAALGGLIAEGSKKDGTGVLAGSLAGALVLLLAVGFAGANDTLGVLVAVLDTQFWLTTHVLTITAGYGWCLLTALVAHGWLLRRACGYGERTEGVLRVQRLALMALFLTTIGTALGGVWADQSWGRFWGWDPKENGALLIILWLLWVLHGRVAGLMKPVLFMAGMALTTVVVGASWIGVNLLGVGLHSYGFTQGVALGLLLFSVGEIVLVGGMMVWPMIGKPRLKK